MEVSRGGPAGSLEPLSVGTTGKWTDGVGGMELATLRALADDINKTVDTTVKQVARGKIRVGKLLLEARALLPNDIQFGLWRVQNTSVQSKQHAHYLMQVAKRFGDAPKLIEGANYSVMQELVLADQEDIKWIEDKIDAGEPLPKVSEVRAKVKQTQADRLKGTSKKGIERSIPVGVIASPHASINALVLLPLPMRIRRVVDQEIKGIEGDFIILGMDPDPQCPCHPETLDAIAEMWSNETDNGDELHAITCSHERIIEAFKHWNQS